MTRSQDIPQTSHPAQAVALGRKVARRVNRGVYLTRAAAPVAGALIAFGLLYLFAQMLAPHLSRYTFGALILLPVALMWAWRKCKRNCLFFSDDDVIALVDKLGQADGLATTAWERPNLIGDRAWWNSLGSRLNTRPLRLAPSYFAWRLVPAFAFAGVVMLVPARKPAAGNPVNVMAGLTQPLQDKLKMSAEVLPEAEREKLQEQLDQLETVDSSVTRENWEAVEEVQQSLENALAQSDAAVQQLTKSLDEMGQLASQMANAKGGNQEAALQNNMESMAKSIEDLINNGNTPLDKQMKEQLQKAMSQCKGGNCSAGDLDKLRERAEALRQNISKKLASPKPGSKAGSGGVNRGRGDAALEFGAESHLDAATFDPKQLQNQYFDEASLTDLGITVIEPKAEPGKFKAGTVKQFSAPVGSNVSRTEIAPSQRGVVSRYFQ